jgi:hypothetical protein
MVASSNDVAQFPADVFYMTPKPLCCIQVDLSHYGLGNVHSWFIFKIALALFIPCPLHWSKIKLIYYF